MDNQVFRSKSLSQISSPEQLNDYLHVTSPSVWLVLIAIIMMLVGALIWSSTASLDSFAKGTAQVKDGAMVIAFDDEQIAANVEPGMTVSIGDTKVSISSVGADENGKRFATADTTLADGVYDCNVLFKSTKVLQLLFN